MNIETMTPEQVRTKAVVDGVTGWTEKRLGEITDVIEKKLSDAILELRSELQKEGVDFRSESFRIDKKLWEVTDGIEKQFASAIGGLRDELRMEIDAARYAAIEKAKAEVMDSVRGSIDADADRRMEAVKELTKTIAALPAPNVNVEAPSVNVDAPQVFIDPRIVDLLDALKRGHEVMQLQMVSLSRQLLESIRRQEEAFTMLVEKLQERSDKEISVQFSDDGKSATVR